IQGYPRATVLQCRRKVEGLAISCGAGIILDAFLRPFGPAHQLCEFHLLWATPLRIEADAPRTGQFLRSGIGRKIASRGTTRVAVNGLAKNDKHGAVGSKLQRQRSSAARLLEGSSRAGFASDRIP